MLYPFTLHLYGIRVNHRPITRGEQERGEAPLGKYFTPLGKDVGYSLKIFHIVQKIWAVSENSPPLLVSQAGYGSGRL